MWTLMQCKERVFMSGEDTLNSKRNMTSIRAKKYKKIWIQNAKFWIWAAATARDRADRGICTENRPFDVASKMDAFTDLVGHEKRSKMACTSLPRPVRCCTCKVFVLSHSLSSELQFTNHLRPQRPLYWA